jgi:hypothetical protein
MTDNYNALFLAIVTNMSVGNALKAVGLLKKPVKERVYNVKRLCK